MVTANFSDEGSKIVTLTPLTGKGKPTKIDTQDRQPTATVKSGPVTADLTVAEDGKLKVHVKHTTLAEGADFEAYEVEVNADADRDPGEDRAITESIVGVVTRAEAASMSAEVSDEIPDEEGTAGGDGQ